MKDEATSDIDDRPRHVAIAVPLRAVERNRRVAATVLAGGFAYRIFLWLLPFGLIVGGGLGLADARSTEDAVEGGGIPAAVSNAVGDAALIVPLVSRPHATNREGESRGGERHRRSITRPGRQR